jgi:hypothetical protein
MTGGWAPDYCYRRLTDTCAPQNLDPLGLSLARSGQNVDGEEKYVPHKSENTTTPIVHKLRADPSCGIN